MLKQEIGEDKKLSDNYGEIIYCHCFMLKGIPEDTL